MEVLTQIDNSLGANKMQHSPPNVPQNAWYFLIQFNDFKGPGNYAKQSRKFKVPSNNIPILMAAVDMNLGKDIAASFEQNPQAFFEGQTLNISGLRGKGFTTNFSLEGTISFLLLLAASFSEMNHIEVNHINYENNGIIRNKSSFFNINALFPSLKTISLNGTTSPADLRNFLSNLNITIADAPSQEGVAAAGQPPIEYNPYCVFVNGPGRPSGFFQQQAVNLQNQVQIVGQAVTAESPLENYEHIQIDPDDFPTNQTFIDFFDCSFSEIGSLGRFYDKDAMFSVTVDACGPHSPLERFKQFSRNMTEDDTNIVKGTKAVVEAQKVVFGDSFWAYPQQMHCSELASGLFAAVFHGVMQTIDGNIIGFDRSFTLCRRESAFVILNDHVFLRNAPN